MAYLSENNQPDFGKMPDGLVPAIVQDDRTGQVLMLGYMDRSALEQTLSTGLVTFFSRSKQRLWTKGETSGNTLQLRQLLIDCDQDALLVKAIPAGPTCHTGDDTCWGEQYIVPHFLPELAKLIQQRKQDAPEGSYTAKLFASGIPKIAQKVGEEAVETVIEALGTRTDLLLNESADLLYHLLVLLEAKGVSLAAVEEVLRHRHAKTAPA